MNAQPDYFDSIRQKAARRWEQLEQDPELAAPWHQLFKQVQSPRHVLSELLQNADDAGATEAAVRIEDQVFIFEHNGEDFTEEHFASLCRFGYSNKRALHTIGFRGIGFKSIFSLGDCVELFTPTLAIRFDRKRFTEPCWQPQGLETHGKTSIRVVIHDQHRQKEVEKNLQEWLKSPLSLLFFKNIRRLQIDDRTVHWGSFGPGPIRNSEWMALHEQDDEAFLLLRSEAEMFPEEALAEIRQERMLGDENDTDFPPCTIEIVVGAKGQLFVVLPTGVETELPFACNAPFIQDPARLKIKDPETSPTNRWLLERAGRLAASAMLSWLEQTEMPVVERVDAYDLLPDVDRQNNTLQGVCGTIVEIAFAGAMTGQPLLLTDGSDLVCEKESIIVPVAIFGIWEADQATVLLDNRGRPPLCQYIKIANQGKLLHWGFVEQFDKQSLLHALQTQHLPKPKTWYHLLNLWAYIAPEITNYWNPVKADNLRIVPVQGKDVLYAANEVVRLAEKKLLQSEDDWEFLAAHLIVLNQNWPRFLADQRRSGEEQEDQSAQEAINAANAILQKIRLDEASNVNMVVDQVASKFFAQERVNLQECVRLAQIAAKLGATAGDSFRYVTQDKYRRAIKDKILFDEDSTLADLLPDYLQSSQLLHTDYTAKFSACSQEEWLRWVSSGRAGLQTFVPLVQMFGKMYSKQRIEQEARRRGLKRNIVYPYVTHEFSIEDWDLDKDYWNYWRKLAADDEQVWMKIVERILHQRPNYWNQAKSARLLQVATTGNKRSITDESLLPSWVLHLRDVPCLPDTRGFRRKPGDLLRRTPETESLMDVEPFVHGRFDNEATRPLLDLLGVQSSPTGPGRLLDRLRALAKAEKPPLPEVEKWYRRLDQMVDTCSTADFQMIKQAFHTEKLVLTQSHGWATAAAVYLYADEEDVPGVAVIRTSICDLTLWRKIDVAERATVELAIEWLKRLPSGIVPSPDDARRVRALLARHPHRVWTECRHWLNLASEWMSVEHLRYALTMQSLISWGHLHPWAKQKTADLRHLPRDVTSQLPFADLLPLTQHLEERLYQNSLSAGWSEQKEWLITIGTELQRIELDTEANTQYIRAVAERLADTKWHTTQLLQVIPYLEGTPAGTPRQADILWSDQILYVAQLPKAKLAKRVPEEIGNAFERDDIRAALNYSFERSPKDVREYLEENFKLAPRASIPEIASHQTLESGKDIGDVTIIPGQGDSARSQKPPTLQPEIAEDEANVVTVVTQRDDESNDDITTDIKSNELMPERPDDVEENPTHIQDQPAARPRPAPKPAKPNIIERFAKAQGFSKDGDNRFFHEDGSWIGRTNGTSFPWERRTGTGELVRYYLPKDHCLDREPLPMDADIWEILKHNPKMYALILLSAEEIPTEVTGAHLNAMCDEGTITLYPATYRLVYTHGNHA
jgi:hypothetical protein